ncbi:MAG: response regulator [Cyclobacteriaceae bacterium]
MKVLIVEDSVITALHLQMLVSHNNMEVLASLVEAELVEDQARQGQPDLILMDIMLKGDMTGLEAAREVRKFSPVPIIFLSALTDEESIAQIQAVSNSQRLTKPFQDNELLELISNASTN